MASGTSIFFSPFRLDLLKEHLSRDAQAIPLRPKTFAVLRYLVEHSERLVTKEELLEALWPGVYVTDGALMACIRELRRALGDHARAPRFIETLRGRGYRFIAPLTFSQPVLSSRLHAPGSQLPSVFPDMPERIQQEISLLVSTGASMMATKGAAAPEVERLYTRAHALCRQVGETPQLLPILLGLHLFHEVRGDLRTAHAFVEQCLSLARDTQDEQVLLWAHFALGQTSFHLGDFVAARSYLEHALAFPCLHHNGVQSPVLAGVRIGCGCWLAFSLWALGYPEQALEQMEETLRVAQESAFPYLLAIALTCAAALHVFRREKEEAQQYAQAAVILSTEHGFSQWLGLATVLRGWALAEGGHGKEGIGEIQQGLVTYRATGAELSLPYQFGFLAEAWGKGARPEEGLNALHEAFAVVAKTKACCHKAELYRLKGELLLNVRRSLA